MSKSLRTITALAALLLASNAVAGRRAGSTVVVDTANRTVYGDLGTARNSPDALQYLEAVVYTTASLQYMMVFARDAAGNSAYCNSTSPQFIAAALAVKGDSYLYVNYDASGTCTYVYLSNSSAYQPKQP